MKNIQSANQSIYRAKTLALAVTALLGLSAVVIAATPTQQQAIVQNGYGGPDVLKLETIAVSEPGENQVLVRVYAASFNPADTKARTGTSDNAPASNANTRLVPGQDIAGVVEKLGPGVTSMKVGDAVYGLAARAAGKLNGAYSQYAVASLTNLAPKPANMTFAEAAGLGVAGLTGVRAVMESQVSKGQRVLVTGVAGGVGSAAAQAAKARGAYVVGTASASHNAYLRSIGVDEVIDYTKVRFEEQTKDIDVVIDTVGNDTAERAFIPLKKGGKIISTNYRDLESKCAAAGAVCVSRSGAAAVGRNVYDELSSLAASGKLKIKIDRTFPLAQAVEAQKYGDQGHTEGKIILVVDPAQADKR